MRRFTEDDLRRLYRGVSVARAAETFSGRHGPLEATAWVHVALAEMERLDDALGAAVSGDHDALHAAASLARFEQPMAQPCSSALFDEDELRRAPVGIADPVALAVTVHFLVAGGHPDEGRRLLWFAVRRTAALNLARNATDRHAAGWWSARRFERTLKNASPLDVGGEHAQSGGGDVDQGHRDGEVRGDTHHAGAGHSGAEPGHAAAGAKHGQHGSGCCVDHEPLTDALHRRWQHLVDVVREEAATSMLPASGDASLYERVLDRVDARAGRRPPARSVASSVTPLPAPPQVPTPPDVPQPLLTLTPTTSTVVVGEPVHVWVRLVGATSDAAVVVESADGGRVTVTVKPTEGETLATLPPAREPGSLAIGADAPDLGLTAPSARIEVARARPRCAPHHGGSWELAAVEAHDVPDKCKPAKAVDDAAARLRGHAGALLTGAYNSAVVGSQLCVRNANTRVCARTREDKVRRCTEERDEGYNRCAEQRDQGYRRCCDWAPCSWFCRAWVWVSNIVCVVWEWVSNIVCVAWEWVKNIVCVAWRVVVAAACVIAALAVGVVKAIAGSVALVAGIVTAIIGKGIGALCALFKVRPREEVSDSLKVVAVHMALLPTGKVLLMGYDEGVYPVDGDHPADFTAVADSDRGLCAIWDPATGKARYTRDLRRNLFCAHHSFLPDGRLLVASGQFPLPGLLKELIPPRLLAPGADADVHVFDPRSETWQRLANMENGRWYPTCVTMPDGRVFITSGTNGFATSPGLGRGIQNTWEYADATGPVGGKQNTNFYWFHLYPFQHVLGDGRVFTHAKRTTRLFDPTTSQWSRVAPAGALTAPPGRTPTPGDTVWPYSRTGPGPGTSVLLPLVPSRDGDRWVYPTGRVLILGGGGAEGAPEPEITGEPYDLHADTPATRSAEILDLGQDDAAWRATRPMANGRVMPDSVLLPDGTVLVVGGGRYGRSGGLLAHFASVEQGGAPDKGALDPILEPELFDPVTETWRSLCRKPIGRLYHTTAMLLADGRVVVGGHDGALNMEPYDRSRYELELFSPPYLFAADGSLAPRPVVSRAPERATYGESIEVVVDHRISSAALIRPSALTHQINAEQRYVGLGIVDLDRSGGDIVLAAPPDANVAPPGWYLLFVVDEAGTPSVGHWVQLHTG